MWSDNDYPENREPLAAVKKDGRWLITYFRKDILDRPDDEIIWTTDLDTLQEELHSRTGGTDNYTFVCRTSEDGAVATTITPLWTGPLDVEAVASCAKKYKRLRLPKTSSDWSHHSEEQKNFVKKFKRSTHWKNFEIYGFNTYRAIEIVFNPEAEKERKKLKAERQRAIAADRRYMINITNEQFTAAAHEYLRILKNSSPKDRGLLKRVVESTSHRFLLSQTSFKGMKKIKLIEAICFLINMLRMMSNPHYSQKNPKLRSILGIFEPKVSQLKKMIHPYSQLGNLLEADIENVLKTS